MRLPDPLKSSAVLIGAARYAGQLADIPAVATNLADLQAALTDPDRGGFMAERCWTMADPSSAGVIGQALSQYDVEDTFLVYYAGHGFVDDRGELYLGLPGTDEEALSTTALRYEVVRGVLADLRARNRIVILDCCYSGRALEGFMSSAVSGATEIAGTFVWASSSPSAMSMVSPGERHTAFTGEILRVMAEGVPDTPEVLSLNTLQGLVRSRLREKNLPLPSSTGTGTTDQLGLVVNAAYTGTPTTRERPVERTPRWVVPGFDGEVTRGRDLLGVWPDANALAVLLASTTLVPPLAVGLFGEWGCVKTLFMRTI